MAQLFLLLLCFLPACQASYIVKSSNLAQEVDKSRIFELKNINDDSKKQLADIYQQHQATVLFFWQTKCPCVKRYQARMIDLYKRYSPKNVAFMLIASNSNESKTDITNEYAKRNIPIPLYIDKEAMLAKALKAKSTPTAVLIDNLGNVQFMGWIDNEQDLGEHGRFPYLEKALDEYLSGKIINNKTSAMFGCAIR